LFLAVRTVLASSNSPRLMKTEKEVGMCKTRAGSAVRGRANFPMGSYKKLKLKRAPGTASSEHTCGGHASCACYRPWCLVCTPNAPAAVVPAMHAECACCRGACYARQMRLLPTVAPAMHAECACCRGTCYARRMRLLPWHLPCTPNAPADVAPAMHAECAC
jgi:hypothetical protein